MKIQWAALAAGAMVAVAVTACGGGSSSGVSAGTCSQALGQLSTAPYAVSTGNGTMLWNSAAGAAQVVSSGGDKGTQLYRDLSKLEKASLNGSAPGMAGDLKDVYSDCGKKYPG